LRRRRRLVDADGAVHRSVTFADAFRAITVTGTEKVGWDQIADNAAQLARYTTSATSMMWHRC
jgi:flavin-binding protein dodecin